MNALGLAPSVELVEMECGVCGVVFAVPERFRAERKRDHSRSWFCPNGHERVFAGKTEAEKLREQLADAERQLAFERERASTNFAAREKAERELRRTKKRIRNGVCPSCNRSFDDLKRHMGAKHPDYAEPKV